MGFFVLVLLLFEIGQRRLGHSFVGQEIGWGLERLKGALPWWFFMHMAGAWVPHGLTLFLQVKSHPPGLFHAIKDSHRRAGSGSQTSYTEALRPGSENRK